MNNNFKKLLASAMALAMVTSVMPAATTNVSAKEACSVPNYADVVSKIKGLDEKTVNSDVTVRVSGKTMSIFKYALTDESFNEVNEQCDDTYGVLATRIKGVATEVDQFIDMDGNKIDSKNQDKISAWENELNTVDGKYTVDKIGSNEASALSVLTQIDEFLSRFKNNLTETELDRINEVATAVQDNLDAYYGVGMADYLKDFMTSAERILDAISKQDTITKAQVKEAIKQTKELNNYNRVKNSDEVIALLEEYDAMLEEIEKIELITNSRKNEAFADYIANGTKSVKNKVMEINAKTTTDYKGSTAATLSSYQLADLMGTLKVKEFEILKAFKEEVVDSVWVFETRVFADKHRDKSYPNVYAGPNLNKVTAVFPEYLMKYLADDEEGLFGYDALELYMNDVVKNYEALTSGIKGLDSINLTVSDKEAILAADDALYFFEENGHGNLTTSESREVKKAERKVSELLEAYRVKFGSVTGATGWVDMGNGNWKYYEEDGTAPTKWICTAKDTWYYVSNGVMLRDAWVWRDSESAYYVGNDGKMVYGPTTVNGYELDANGLWHK